MKIQRKYFVSFLLLINLAIMGGYFIFNDRKLSGMQNNQDSLINKLSLLCWIAYAPTGFNPAKNIYPPAHSIEQDLYLLKQKGFDGIVTYGSEKSLAIIPRIAKQMGFKGVIMGVWDPNSFQELRNAVAMKQYVDGYCVGNVGLNKYYNIRRLENVIEYLRTKTKRPVTTTEGIELYHSFDRLLTLGDWIFPDARLYWTLDRHKTPEAFLQRLLEEYEKLVGRTEKPVLIKTVGFPTQGSPEAGYDSQSKMFALLADNSKKFPYERIRFVYFEAFDQPWKSWHAVEPHWGIFHQDRSPKPATRYIWGKNLPISQRLGIAHAPVARNHLDILCFTIAANVLAFGLLFLASRRQHLNSRKILKILPHANKLLWCENGQSTEIVFPKTHNQCVTLLTVFFRHSDSISCGELIHLSGDSRLLEKCIYDHEAKICPEKKQYCQPYKTLSNHRIGTIRKTLQLYGIGDIRIIPGKSKWQVMLRKDVDVIFDSK